MFTKSRRCDDGLQATDGAVAAVRARGLAKSYKGRPAVRGVDLTVAAGETFGFLGPNGAGKSTTMAMLCTMTAPSAGQAWIAGHDVGAHPHQVRRRIGLIFQDTTLDQSLTAWENLRFHARLHGISTAVARERARELLELVDLDGRSDSPVRTFSGGMKRRLEIIRGLMHRPRVLFLDEPTVGLDPQARAQIWEHLRRLRQSERITLFLTTHYLDEAEHCDRIAIIDDGRVIAEDTPGGLKSVLGTDRVELRSSDDRAAAAQLRETFGLRAEERSGGLSVRVDDGAAFVPRMCANLDVAIESVTVVRPSLDEVFFHYTGRGIRESEAGS
ncbi:ABC transporter ATP-binding protein [Actinomadura livida]|uniref:ABC-2 type transport system ATP-binding protein n=1 Tax=Actinomadura livida TaxID=79909 RepID=A0A7W7I7D7_9ACTN|nr:MULTISPECIES: ATP-binding cassette domain-containing protein [Actinomadura]MBB4771793.1 ABC-2 type transport system ATP-binding protein [Actinomadura catellatispora]GGU02529.1 daunorubicin resistance protein DrrA family ABC transporter ATP-binding protein [Actinomadura livida]